MLAANPAPLQNQGMTSLQLYPFRFRDPLTGKWIRARHKTQVPKLQRHYAEWQIIGAPEIRQTQRAGPEQFDPFDRPASTKCPLPG